MLCRFRCYAFAQMNSIHMEQTLWVIAMRFVSSSNGSSSSTMKKFTCFSHRTFDKNKCAIPLLLFVPFDFFPSLFAFARRSKRSNALRVPIALSLFILTRTAIFRLCNAFWIHVAAAAVAVAHVNSSGILFNWWFYYLGFASGKLWTVPLAEKRIDECREIKRLIRKWEHIGCSVLCRQEGRMAQSNFLRIEIIEAITNFPKNSIELRFIWANLPSFTHSIVRLRTIGSRKSHIESQLLSIR